MENISQLDIFGPNDRTALVCMDDASIDRIVVAQLRELNYKVHTGFSMDDLLHKIRAHPYDVIVISENFGATNLSENPLLAEVVNAPASHRHRQVVVLAGASLKTADEIQAFQHSVDVVINLADIGNLHVILKRAVNLVQQFYGRYFEAIAAADVV